MPHPAVPQIWNDHSDFSTSIGEPGLENFVQKRNHLLSNGQKIWDLGGNVSEGVLDAQGVSRGGNFTSVSGEPILRLASPSIFDDDVDRRAILHDGLVVNTAAVVIGPNIWARIRQTVYIRHSSCAAHDRSANDRTHANSNSTTTHNPSGIGLGAAEPERE